MGASAHLAGDATAAFFAVAGATGFAATGFEGTTFPALRGAGARALLAAFARIAVIAGLTDLATEAFLLVAGLAGERDFAVAEEIALPAGGLLAGDLATTFFF